VRRGLFWLLNLSLPTRACDVVGLESLQQALEGHHRPRRLPLEAIECFLRPGHPRPSYAVRVAASHLREDPPQGWVSTPADQAVGYVVSGGNMTRLLFVLGIMAAALASSGCDSGGGETSSEGTGPTAGSDVTTVAEGGDATAFCSDLQAFGQDVGELAGAQVSLELIDDLQQLGSQTVTVLQNDSENLSGSVAIDAQGVISVIETMATTSDPQDFIPNLNAISQEIPPFVSTYC
jgi:hypothetical protein